MTKTLLRFGLAGLMALVAFQGTVSAQTVPATADQAQAVPTAGDPAATAPAAPPVVEPTPTPESDAPMAPAAEAAAQEEEAQSIAGWFRIDYDAGGTQLWAGATFPVGELSLATDIYLAGALGEFDIGPAFTSGQIIVTPMLGVQVDYVTQRAAAIVPQFYLTYDGDGVYFEHWLQAYLYSVFDYAATSFIYTRNILLYEVSEVVALGVEVDLTVNVADQPLKADGSGDDLTLAYLPIGPHIKLSYGPNSYLQLFAGFDVAGEDAGKGKLAGRFSFVHNW